MPRILPNSRLYWFGEGLGYPPTFRLGVTGSEASYPWPDAVAQCVEEVATHGVIGIAHVPQHLVEDRLLPFVVEVGQNPERGPRDWARLCGWHPLRDLFFASEVKASVSSHHVHKLLEARRI